MQTMSIEQWQLQLPLSAQRCSPEHCRSLRTLYFQRGKLQGQRKAIIEKAALQHH
jgi:hypothetical protein